MAAIDYGFAVVLTTRLIQAKPHQVREPVTLHANYMASSAVKRSCLDASGFWRADPLAHCASRPEADRTVVVRVSGDKILSCAGEGGKVQADSIAPPLSNLDVWMRTKSRLHALGGCDSAS